MIDIKPQQIECSLSGGARGALIWLAYSEEASNLTCKEAKVRIATIFGDEISKELEAFFKKD